MDPIGLYFGWDDAAFVIGGGLVSVAGRLTVDLMSGQFSGWNALAGSFAGGAAAGFTLLYTANPVVAGVLGGAVSNVATQALNLRAHKTCHFDTTSLLWDTAWGGALGTFSGAKIPGINSGRDSMLKTFRQMRTNGQSGLWSAITPRVALRAALGGMWDAGFVRTTGFSPLLSSIYAGMIQ